MSSWNHCCPYCGSKYIQSYDFEHYEDCEGIAYACSDCGEYFFAWYNIVFAELTDKDDITIPLHEETREFMSPVDEDMLEKEFEKQERLGNLE